MRGWQTLLLWRRRQLTHTRNTPIHPAQALHLCVLDLHTSLYSGATHSHSYWTYTLPCTLELRTPNAYWKYTHARKNLTSTRELHLVLKEKAADTSQKYTRAPSHWTQPHTPELLIRLAEQPLTHARTAHAHSRISHMHARAPLRRKGKVFFLSEQHWRLTSFWRSPKTCPDNFSSLIEKRRKVCHFLPQVFFCMLVCHGGHIFLLSTDSSSQRLSCFVSSVCTGEEKIPRNQLCTHKHNRGQEPPGNLIHDAEWTKTLFIPGSWDETMLNVKSVISGDGIFRRLCSPLLAPQQFGSMDLIQYCLNIGVSRSHQTSMALLPVTLALSKWQIGTCCNWRPPTPSPRENFRASKQLLHSIPKVFPVVTDVGVCGSTLYVLLYLHYVHAALVPVPPAVWEILSVVPRPRSPCWRRDRSCRRARRLANEFSPRREERLRKDAATEAHSELSLSKVDVKMQQCGSGLGLVE